MWTFWKNLKFKYLLVIEGHVQNGTEVFGTDQLRLESDCSLHISYVSANDAGRYICQYQNKDQEVVDLAVISVFSSIPDSVLKVNDTVTIHCLLHIYNSSSHCNRYMADFSLDWVGSVSHEYHKWSPCNISTKQVLTWNQLGRRVHCKLKYKGVEKASAVYTVTFSNLCNASSTKGRKEGNVACESGVQMKVLGLTIALIAALTVVSCTALLVVLRKQLKNNKAVRERKVSRPNTEEVKEHVHDKVTYVEVHHQNQTHAKRNKRAPEESVWYSALTTREKMKTQDSNLHTVYATAQ